MQVFNCIQRLLGSGICLVSVHLDANQGITSVTTVPVSRPEIHSISIYKTANLAISINVPVLKDRQRLTQLD